MIQQVRETEARGSSTRPGGFSNHCTIRSRETPMPNVERVENLVIGSGGAGKFVAWTMAGAGRRTALVERDLIGGACPNVACLPSKNMIYSAKVISLARRGTEFGLEAGAKHVDMKAVQQRKRLMVEGLRQMHLDRTK